MAKNNEEKFTWKAGDIEVRFSQCKGCIRNLSATECEIYKEKPKAYADNEESCPDRKEGG